MLADISYKTGPPSIRNENGQLVGFVFVDITSDDIQGYVDAASKRINEVVQFPPGYYMQWAGQFEYLKSAEQRLKIVVPFTLLIIFVLIYMNTQSAVKTFIVLLGRSVLASRCVLVSLPARLQHEHRRVGRPHRAGRPRCRNRRRDAALPRPRLGQIPQRRTHEFHDRPA